MPTNDQPHSNLQHPLRKTLALNFYQEDHDLTVNSRLGSTTFKDDWIAEGSSVSSTFPSPTESCATTILDDFEEEWQRIVDDLPVEVRSRIDGIIKRYKTQEEQLSAIEEIVQDFAWNLRFCVPVDDAPEGPESGIGSDNDSGSPLTGHDSLLPPEDIDEFIARNFVHSPPKASRPSDSTLKFLRDLEASQVKVRSRKVVVGTTSNGCHGRPPEAVTCAEEIVREGTSDMFPNSLRHLGMREGECSRSRNSNGKRRDARTKSVMKVGLNAQEGFGDVTDRISSKPVSAQVLRSGIPYETLRAPLPHTTCLSGDFDDGDLERATLIGINGLDFQSTAFTTARSRRPVMETTNSDELGVSRLLRDSRGDDSKDLRKMHRSISEVESATPSRLGEPAALVKDDSEKRSGLMSESVSTADVPAMRSQKPVQVRPVPVKPVPVKPVRTKPFPSKSVSVKAVPVKPIHVEPVPVDPVPVKPVPVEPVPGKKGEYDPNEFLRVPVRRRNGRLTPVTSTLRPRVIDRTRSLAEEDTMCIVSDKIQVMDPTSIRVIDSARNHVVDPERFQMAEPERFQVVDSEKFQVGDSTKNHMADSERFQVVDPEKIKACHRRRANPRLRCSSVQEEPVWSRVSTSGSTVLDNFSTSGASVLEKIRARLNGSAKSSGVSRPISKASRSQCVDEEQLGIANTIGKPSRPKSSILRPFTAGPKESKRNASKAVNSMSSQLWFQADHYSSDSRGTRWNEIEQHSCTSPTFHTFLGDARPLRWTEEDEKGSLVRQEATFRASEVDDVVSTGRKDKEENGFCKQGDQWNAGMTGQDSKSTSLSSGKENLVTRSCVHEAMKPNGVEIHKGLRYVNEMNYVDPHGSNCANELSNVKGLSNVEGLNNIEGLSNVNGSNCANGLQVVNGLNSASGLSNVNGSYFANGLSRANKLNVVNGLCLNISSRATSEAKESGSRANPRRLPLCPVKNPAELDSPTRKIRGSDSPTSTSIPRTTLVDELNLDFRKDSWTTNDEWSVNYSAATAASEASTAISKLLQRLYSDSSNCSSSPVNDRTVLRADFDDRRLALVSAHDRFTGDCRAMTCSAPRSNDALVDSIGTSMRSFTELVYRCSRLLESISLRTDTDKVKDAVKVVAIAYHKTITAASDVYEQALRSSDGYNQALRSSDGYSQALRSSDFHNEELTSTDHNLIQSPESDSSERRKRVRKAIQRPASELVDALCSLKTLIQNLDYDKLPRRF